MYQQGVVPHHDTIHENRKQGHGGSTIKGSMLKKTAELRTQISELESTNRRMIAEMKTIPLEDKKPKSGQGGSVSGSHAGTDFGGRA